MDKPERDAIEELAQAAQSEHWCLHPNGTSVWTGEEYTPELDHRQHVVCQAPLPFAEGEVRRMEFIAGCSPAVVLDLLEFYGLSDTHLELGVADPDEICNVCGHETTEGHTHQVCFEHGKGAGALDENFDCAGKLAEALGIEYHGESFDEVLKCVK